MIDIIARPTSTAFAKNPLIYRFRAKDAATNLPYRAYGQRAVFLTTATQLTEGDTLTLTITEPDTTVTTLVFVAKNNPTTDLHVPANAPLSSVARFIGAHRYVAPTATVYYAPDVVTGKETIVAEIREVAPNWTITFLFTVQNAANEELKTHNYTTSNAPDNYGMAYEVFFEPQYNERKWQRVHRGTLRLRDDGGDIYLNLSDIIAAESQTSLKENPFRAVRKDGASATDNLRRYYIRVKEVGDGITPTWNDPEPILSAVMGGIPNQQWLSRDWFNFQNGEEAKTWLTYRPSVQTVRFDAVNWLTWYNPLGDVANIRLEISYILNNGEEHDLLVVNSLSAVPKDRALTFCITPSVLLIPDTTRYFKVRVMQVDTDIPLSSWREYVLDTAQHRNVRTIAYINSFGCPETYTCKGELSKTFTHQALQTEAVRGVNYAGGVQRTERAVYDLGMGYTYRSGLINTELREALTEVGLSPVLFDITASRYLALTLKGEKSGVISDTFNHTDERLYSIEWQTALRISLGVWGTDSAIRGSDSLAEPVMALGTLGEETEPPFDLPTDDGSPTPPDNFLELDTLNDSDLIVFARLNQNGAIAGFYTFQNGKYRRLVRGLPFTAPSALDGVGYKAADGQKWIEKVAENGDLITTKQ
jgi:hypothetical protein